MAFSVFKAIVAGLSGGPRARARSADLVVLPLRVEGTNCANCSFATNPVQRADGIVEGDCIHPLVRLRVTSRECCSFWDSAGTVRVADLPDVPEAVGVSIQSVGR